MAELFSDFQVSKLLLFIQDVPSDYDSQFAMEAITMLFSVR